MFKYKLTDSGYCRVYYRSNGKLYCFQEEFKGQFSFYVCSKDGEPSHIVKFNIKDIPRSEDDNSIDERFNKWLEEAKG